MDQSKTWSGLNWCDSHPNQERPCGLAPCSTPTAREGRDPEGLSVILASCRQKAQAGNQGHFQAIKTSGFGLLAGAFCTEMALVGAARSAKQPPKAATMLNFIPALHQSGKWEGCFPGCVRASLSSCVPRFVLSLPLTQTLNSSLTCRWAAPEWRD